MDIDMVDSSEVLLGNESDDSSRLDSRPSTSSESTDLFTTLLKKAEDCMDTEMVANPGGMLGNDFPNTGNDSFRLDSTPSTSSESAHFLNHSRKSKERKIDLFVRNFEKDRLKYLNENTKLRKELDQLLNEVKERDSLLEKQGDLVSRQRDTIKALHNLLKNAQIVTSKLKYDNTNVSRIDRRTPMVMTPPEIRLGSSAGYIPNLSISSRPFVTPNSVVAASKQNGFAFCPASLVPEMSRLPTPSPQQQPTNIIDMMEVEPVSKSSVTRINVKIEKLTKTKNVGEYIRPGGLMILPLEIPQEVRKSSLKSDHMKIKFAEIDRRDLICSGKIHGFIEYPKGPNKSDRFCGFHYYIESYHRRWKLSPFVPTRDCGSTKFTIEIPKDLTEGSYPDRLVIFGVLKSTVGSFYSPRLMFPITEPVQKRWTDVQGSSSSKIQGNQTRSNFIGIENCSDYGVDVLGSSSRQSEGVCVPNVDAGEYEVYRP